MERTTLFLPLSLLLFGFKVQDLNIAGWKKGAIPVKLLSAV